MQDLLNKKITTVQVHISWYMHSLYQLHLSGSQRIYFCLIINPFVFHSFFLALSLLFLELQTLSKYNFKNVLWTAMYNFNSSQVVMSSYCMLCKLIWLFLWAPFSVCKIVLNLVIAFSANWLDYLGSFAVCLSGYMQYVAFF